MTDAEYLEAVERIKRQEGYAQSVILAPAQWEVMKQFFDSLYEEALEKKRQEQAKEDFKNDFEKHLNE